MNTLQAPHAILILSLVGSLKFQVAQCKTRTWILLFLSLKNKDKMTKGKAANMPIEM